MRTIMIVLAALTLSVVLVLPAEAVQVPLPGHLLFENKASANGVCGGTVERYTPLAVDRSIKLIVTPTADCAVEVDVYRGAAGTLSNSGPAVLGSVYWTCVPDCVDEQTKVTSMNFNSCAPEFISSTSHAAPGWTWTESGPHGTDQHGQAIVCGWRHTTEFVAQNPYIAPIQIHHFGQRESCWSEASSPGPHTTYCQRTPSLEQQTISFIVESGETEIKSLI